MDSPPLPNIRHDIIPGVLDPRRRRQSEGPRFPYRQILDRARHPSGWRSSLETRPHQSVGSFLGELIIAAGVFVIIAVLILRFA
jgi:hypothetical protein